MTTDAELVDQLDQVWRSLADLGASHDEAEWKRATDVPGWSVQDNLTHISGLEAERTHEELLRLGGAYAAVWEKQRLSESLERA
jgi:hypothetical protein